jgi:hypothetical protein
MLKTKTPPVARKPTAADVGSTLKISLAQKLPKEEYGNTPLNPIDAWRSSARLGGLPGG